jgi:hypothetical protein
MVENWKIKPAPSQALDKLEKMIGGQPLRSVLGLKSRQYSSLELGLYLALNAFEVPDASFIQRIGMKTGIFNPGKKVFSGFTFEQETSAYFLFVLACLKNGAHESILKDQIFGIADMIIKTNVFRFPNENKNEYWNVSLPLLFYYQDKDKREVIDCMGLNASKDPTASKRKFYRFQNFKTRLGQDKILLSLDNHCPTFISKKLAPLLITGACNIVMKCNQECIGNSDCPWKNIYYSTLRRQLSNSINLNKAIKKLYTLCNSQPYIEFHRKQ